MKVEARGLFEVDAPTLFDFAGDRVPPTPEEPPCARSDANLDPPAQTAAPEPEDAFDDDDRDFIDVGADPDAAWDPDPLPDDAADEDPDKPREPAPICDECKIAATIHGWASPHGREGFPCPPGSFERDRAAYEASIHVGQRTERHGTTWEVTQYAYTIKTEDRPAWYTRDVLGANLERFRSANCYGAHWVERRVVRADLFTRSTEARP
ncbi:MAG: hypothetical protein JWO85_2657 [Candidatus Eremiobacteraeota bacterium]|nr:hypothetical protein [Candidatus Eremiobacteraeota bacterium]